MIRLYVVVEGQTEESLVKRVLVPHLWNHDIFAQPIVVTTRRDRTGQKIGKGGGRWKHWCKDIRTLFLDHGTEARFTTLFDLYGLPDDFPGAGQHDSLADTRERAAELERAMAEALPDHRLIPYLQRHEFEALVLVGLQALRSVLDSPEDLAGLKALEAEIGATPPEEVDDGKDTAPSKRLQRHIPSYQKTVHGPLVCEAVGLPALRAACPRFNDWVSRLEQLGHS